MAMPQRAESTDRRQASRIPVAGTVRTAKGVGVAHDVSSTDIFFESDEPYTLGESIDLSLVLERPDASVPIRLMGRGHVVRVEPRGRKIGIGVAVTWGVIERDEGARPDA
jgi:hypothetical protein